MKKLIPVLAASVLAYAAQAQSVTDRGASTVVQPHREAAVYLPQDAPSATQSRHNAKTTTATVFLTDTFNTNSLTTGGWVAGGNTGSASWRFTNVASSGIYGLGTFRGYTTGSTRAGGWMLYDCDSIGKLNPSLTPLIGTLTSPSINCATHTYVGVRFQQYTRRFQDTFYLNVSNNGGASWTRYNIFPNNGLTINQSLDNPTTTTINISATAANQSNVKVQFYYSGAYVGGAYNWMVDDFMMLDLDPIDLGVRRSGVTTNLHGPYGFGAVGTLPKYFADTVFPATHLYNIGGTGQFNATVNAGIAFSGSPVYTKSLVRTDVPINAYDTPANFSSLPGYKPTTSGTYLTYFNVNQTGDGNAANNVDSLTFALSDTSMGVFPGFRESSMTLNPFYLQGGYYLHNTGGAAGYSFYTGTLFEIPAGTKKDTISSVSVSIYPGTTVGSQFVVEIYKRDLGANSYIAKGRTFTRIITAADVSPSNSNLTFINLQMNPGTTNSYVVADSGLWAVVARPINPTPSQLILLTNVKPGAPASLVGNYGVGDTSSGVQYGYGTALATSTTYKTYETVPAILVNFGDIPRITKGVSGIIGLTVGDAYPNPAHNTVSIPLMATVGGQVSVRLYNALGQMVAQQDMGMISAGHQTSAVLSTASLPDGIYMCTVECGGGRETKRVVVTH